MVDLGGQQKHQIKRRYDYGCVEEEIGLDVLVGVVSKRIVIGY